jgi:quinol-cytochrome oxidoreductase complex cytochrome b subunit
MMLNRIRKLNIIGDLYETGIVYPTVSNLSYFWNFGVLALVCLVVQIITGVFLAMHYTPEQSLAFFSVEHIMRDVNLGWLIRYLHSNGASMFFIVVYIHIFRGLYYGSYLSPREGLWLVGVLILLLMILTAFMGYVLPWGQMSFWGATVITNLVSAIPKIGGEIVIWLWGGYSINNATLNRFFSLHYLFPFIIMGLVVLHLILLHTDGSNNPLGISLKRDTIPFYPYYIIKDLYGIVLFFLFFGLFVFFYPNVLGHPDNYIAANPMVTPAHIVPEWYFLPFYAILRSIPDKLMGVIALLFGILVLFFLPFIVSPEIRSNDFRPLANFFFWVFFVDALILGWVGGKPVEEPYVQIAQLATIFYFSYFLFILPVLAWFENSIFVKKEK